VGVQLSVARRIARIQRGQNGAIGGEQLRAAGLTRDAIRARIARGRLVRIFRDVYAVGDPELMPLVRPAAALIALGPNSFVSHRSAAAAWGLADADPALIDVTVVGGKPRARDGLRLHRVKQLHLADTATRSKLRVTSLARTAIDFAAQASGSELHQAFGEARAKRRLTDRALHAALDRLPANHPGAAIVRSMLSAGATYDRSEAERVMRNLCRQAQLPEPLVNQMRNGFLVDFLWPGARLILEVDGHGTHGTRRAFENDRRRDQVHAAAGFVVIRVTWEQLQNEPLAVIARIAQALAHRRAA
jgi:very-short-patch-repair endonuclease/predicted transcriptional regulator of viral defense system